MADRTSSMNTLKENESWENDVFFLPDLTYTEDEKIGVTDGLTGVNIWGHSFNNIRYADDTMLITVSEVTPP